MSGNRVIPKNTSGGVSNHNILSTEHSDTTKATLQAGDVLIVGADGKLTRLAKGTSAQVLKMGSSLPEWGADASNLAMSRHGILSGTWHDGVASPTVSRGSILIVNSSSSVTTLGVGASGAMLMSDGTDPYWSTTLSIANLDMSAADFSIPFQMGTKAAAITEGWSYFNSDTHKFTIGIGSSAITIVDQNNMDMTNSQYSIPWQVTTGAAPTTEGYAHWNSTNDQLTVGSGATAVKQIGVNTTRLFEVEAVPCGWFIPGTNTCTVVTLSSTNKARYVDFGPNNSNAYFEWFVPYGIDTTIAPTFKVEGWISNATGPSAGQTAQFSLAGTSLANSGILSTALGVATTITYAFAGDEVQYDRFATDWSGGVTITSLDAEEGVIFQVARSVDNGTYKLALGVGSLRIKFAKKFQES